MIRSIKFFGKRGRKVPYPLFLGVLFLGICGFSAATVQAGYVWTENASGAYSGTAAPWSSDAMRDGKWVLLGTQNTFTDDLNVTGNGANQKLTIDGATVSCGNAARIGQDNNPAYLTIQNGGTLSLSSTLSISDSSKVSEGHVTVNGGTLKSTNEIRVGFHWNGYLDVTNGGTVEADNIMLGGVYRLGRGYLTIGGEDSSTNTGSVTTNSFSMGANGPSTVTIHRGTLTVNTGNAILGTADDLTELVSADVLLNVGQYGSLAVSKGILSVSNNAKKDCVLNVTGGTVSAVRVILGDVAGKGTLNVENGTENDAFVTAQENLVVGNKGIGELNLKSGTVLVGTVSGQTTTYKSFYVGGYDTAGVGSGTANISGGELKVNGLYVGYQSQGAMNITGGTVTAMGLLSVGTYASANGEVVIGSADGQNVPTVSVADQVRISESGTGSLTLKNGTLTAKQIQIGSTTNAGTMNVWGGTVETTDWMTLTNSSTLKIGSADGQNTPTVSLGGLLMLTNSSTLNMTNGTLRASQIQVASDAVLNLVGGTVTAQSSINIGNRADTTGYAHLGSANAEECTELNLTGTMNIGSNGGNGVVTVRNGNVILTGSCNVGAAANSLGTLDIGAGGVMQIKKTTVDTIVRLGSAGSTASGTLLIHDGGKLTVDEGLRFLVGDVAGGKNYIDITGAGSELQVNATDFCLGYHGTAYVTITDGGKIVGSSIRLGVNRAGDTVLPSELVLTGQGSLLQATSRLTLGSNVQTGILSINASETGLGQVDAAAITLYAGSTIRVGVDHGIAMIRNYTDAGYEVLKTASNITLNASDVWTLDTTTSGSLRTTTATLNEAFRQEGTLRTGGDTVDISDALRESGWIEADFGQDTLVNLTFTGLDTMTESQLLADWLSEGTDDAFSASVAGLGILTLSDLLPGTGVFAWDFSEFNAANGLNVGLLSATAYVPEPSAMVLLFLGCFLVFCKKRVVMKRICIFGFCVVLATGSLFAADTEIQVVTSDWVTSSDWTNGVPGAADNAYVGNNATVTAAGPIDVTTLTVGYSNKTRPGAGTLTISNGLTTGTLNIGSEANAGSLSVAGSTATVGAGTGTFTIVKGTADFSGVKTLTVNVESITMASMFSEEKVNAATVWKLGENSTVTADSLTMLDAVGANLAGSTAAITLGAGTTTLQIDALKIGGGKAMKTGGTGGATLDVAAGGSVILTGKNGAGSKASLRIAYNNTATSTSNPSFGTVDFSAANSVNLTLSDWAVGYNAQLGSNVNGETTGILRLGNNATVTADSLAIGTYDTAKGQTGYSNGTVTGAGTITIGTTQTPGSMTMGSGWASRSTLTLSGGTLTVHGDLNGAGNIAMTLGTSGNAQRFIVDSGTVNLGNGSGSLTLIRGDIDFSAVENVTVNLSNIYLVTTASGETTATSTWTLGTNNTITATRLVMADSPSGSNLSGQQVTLQLGAGTNDLNIDNFIVGGGKANGTNRDATGESAKLLIEDGGTVTLDGKTTGALANLRIGYNTAANTGDVSHGLVDFSNASEVTMNLNALTIGYNDQTSNTNAVNTRYTTGELKLGENATVTAQSVTLGTFNAANTNKNSVQGTLSFSGDTKITVAGTITMGQDSTLSHSTINMAGGALLAERMTMAGNATFNWTGGVLGVDAVDFALTQNAADTELNPGGSGMVGSTTITGNYTLDAGTLRLELGETGADVLNIVGEFSISDDAQFVIDILSREGLTENMTLLTSTGTTMPELTPLYVGDTTLTETWSLSWLGTAGNWALRLHTDVPEPGTLGMFLFGLLLLFRRKARAV